MQTTRLHIAGMTCSACSARIEKALGRVNGVHHVAVNLASGQGAVAHDPALVDVAAIMTRIQQLGYTAEVEKPQSEAGFDDEIRSYRNRLVVAACLSIPLLWSMTSHVTGLWIPGSLHHPVVQWLVATALLLYAGYPFYYGAFHALKQRSANMDVLVALSTFTAYLYSHYLVFGDRMNAGHMLYFDTIAMILTAVLLGKLLESVAKGRAYRAMSGLYRLQSSHVRVIRGQGEQMIPAAELRIGDTVVVRPGEWISADGVVVSGRSDVDESLLTGEHMSVVKAAGDTVFSGTRSLNGGLRIQAEALSGSTRLARMIALVEQAQLVKPLIGRKVDRIAGVFVPVMIGIALLTFAVWFTTSAAEDAGAAAIRHAMAVLLVACPCALGLASPVSILIASGLSARSGILFKEGRFLETLERIDVVLLDKTGTLTEGKPEVIAVAAAHGSDSRLLRQAAAVELQARHPLAEAVVREARRKRLVLPEAANVAEIPGCGASGTVEGRAVLVGSARWLQSSGIRMDERGFAIARPADHATVAHVAIDGRWAGAIVMADRLKAEATQAVRSLRRHAEVAMVTGDREQAARSAASHAGIGRIYAGMLPEQKLELIRSLQSEGRRVAMVGDGMNDAAALAAADVGIAMGGGTDPALQAGDVVLAANRLSGVAEALSISRKTMRNIRQNIGFSIVYNVVTVPLAATGNLDPRVACVLMAFSSVLVVCNALRLNRIRSAAPARQSSE